MIQLQDEDGPPLSEAAEAFKRAAALDERNAEAWVELGHYQFAVDDDAKSAEKSFSRAIEESREALVAALLGRAAALEELGRKAEAFDWLSTARNLQHAAGANNGAAAEETSVFQQWESLTSNS